MKMNMSDLRVCPKVKRNQAENTNCSRTSLSLAIMLSGANAFEISDIQGHEIKSVLTKAIRM